MGSNWPDAQAIDEDVDQPQNACLPTRLIMHIAHAHKRTQDVFRADVVADLAGRDRPVQQGADGPRQPIERIGEQFGVLVGGRWSCDNPCGVSF